MKANLILMISLLVIPLILAACSPSQGVLDIQINPAVQTGSDELLDNLKPIARMILSGEYDNLIEMTQFLITPCTKMDGLGGPPKCLEGQAEGTLVEVFPISGMEGSYETKETIFRSFAFGVKGLHAVYRVPADAYQESYWPAGEYALIFDRDMNDIPMPITLRVKDGKIVRLDFHFGVSIEELLQSIPVELVIIPPSEIEKWLNTSDE